MLDRYTCVDDSLAQMLSFRVWLEDIVRVMERGAAVKKDDVWP